MRSSTTAIFTSALQWGWQMLQTIIRAYARFSFPMDSAGVETQRGENQGIISLQHGDTCSNRRSNFRAGNCNSCAAATRTPSNSSSDRRAKPEHGLRG
jgi:hypothetical protein